MNLKLQQSKNCSFWVISDIHFWHKNVIRYSDRPFDSVEEMNETIIDNWNSKVKAQDIVFNLGDFAFCGTNKVIEILRRLNGTQYFTYGNHDKVMKRDEVQEFCKDTKKIALFADTIEFNYKGTPIFMSHYSHRVWNRSHRGAIHLYGHSHGSLPGIGRSMDVGVDTKELVSDYTPFSLDTVVEFLSHKPIHKADHQ